MSDVTKAIVVKCNKYITQQISKDGRFFASENVTQHKCNDILKKYN